MKLNSKKCTFSEEEGMFLGHVVNTKGIKACPEKADAVVKLQSPRTLKEVQSLNGKLARLNRFLSKSTEKLMPFFKTLKRCIKKSNFQWTPKAEQAFEEMKQRIAALPMLTAPKPKEWAVELGEHDINYRPRTSIIGQILADFIAKKPEEEPPASSIPAEEETLEPLTLFTDGSPCLEGSKAGLILKIPEGVEFTYAMRFEFEASNNEAGGVPHLTVGS
ncbi:reverse transcriptase domain-containing protein [Tanacetum coccineum]